MNSIIEPDPDLTSVLEYLDSAVGKKNIKEHFEKEQYNAEQLKQSLEKSYNEEQIALNVKIGTDHQTIFISRKELQKAIIASGVLDELNQMKQNYDLQNARF